MVLQIIYVIIVIINKPLKFIITIVIITSLFIHVLTQQHNRQLQNNTYGEKDKRRHGRQINRNHLVHRAQKMLYLKEENKTSLAIANEKFFYMLTTQTQKCNVFH